jgi:alkylation response protein AidB-like acyl-CoA dehydrogenase
MDFRFTPEQDAFRTEIRTFLAEELPQEANRRTRVSQAFSKKLADRGWIGVAWPKEYHGGGLGMIEQLIFREEMVSAEAPIQYHMVGERQVGPSLLLRGSDEQRDEIIPRILNADVSFALGLSEPSAGSDLASVVTRAVRDGDEFVVNGQKIWTSFAHQADMIWLVVRTNADAPKHKGISVLMVDLRSPGIQIRPLINMADTHDFNEVFFEDVRVPVSACVGEEDQGWYLLAEHLDFERSGIERIVTARRLFEQVVAYVQALPRDSAARRRGRTLLTDLAVELEIGRLFAYHAAWQQSQGLLPNHEASMSKLFGTEWQQRMGRAAMQIAGLAAGGVRAGSEATIDAFLLRLQRQYLNSVSLTIAGGTSEIQRNIMATRGLGLPRS